MTKTASLSQWDIAAINKAYPCGDGPEPTVEPTTEPGTWEPTGTMATTSEYWTEDASTTEEYRSTTREYTTEEPYTTVPPIRVFGGNMDLTGVSDYGRIWTFVPNTDLLHAENLDTSKGEWSPLNLKISVNLLHLSLANGIFPKSYARRYRECKECRPSLFQTAELRCIMSR